MPKSNMWQKQIHYLLEQKYISVFRFSFLGWEGVQEKEKAKVRMMVFDGGRRVTCSLMEIHGSPSQYMCVFWGQGMRFLHQHITYYYLQTRWLWLTGKSVSGGRFENFVSSIFVGLKAWNGICLVWYWRCGCQTQSPFS